MIVNRQHIAWNSAYATYANELRDFVRARMDKAEAEDLLQDVWSNFAATLEREDIDQTRAWLYRVARNRIADYYRRAHGRPAFQDLNDDLYLTEEDSFPDPDAAWEEIEGALELLPANQRAVFVRNELDGETLREIATDLGLPLKTIISRKGYARRRLRELLYDLYEDYFGEA